MWRNGTRNGLKIAVLAISLLCAAYQTWTVWLGKSPEFANFVPFFRTGAEIASF
jgi:hypothetical protein